jgi:hypothetical protein
MVQLKVRTKNGVGFCNKSVEIRENMSNKLFHLAIIACIFLSGISPKLHASASRNAAQDLAARIADARVESLTKDEWGPEWQELDRRLDRLFANNTKEADEAIVILHSFYLGEHNGEEMRENLLRRGTRMIPILERYRQEEPSSFY